jgi:hypothetical protein
MKYIYTPLAAFLFLCKVQLNAQCSATLGYSFEPYTMYGDVYLENFVGDSNTTSITWTFGCNGVSYSTGILMAEAYMANGAGQLINDCELCVHLSDSGSNCNYSFCDSIHINPIPNTGNCSVSLTATPYSGDTIYMVTASTIGAPPFDFVWDGDLSVYYR